jgi:hypothetical protein
MNGNASPGRYLAPVSITRRDESMWRAIVAFTVPDVPVGDYLVAVCDPGCHEGVGDLVGAPTVIASSAEEGRLLLQMQRADFRARTAKQRLGKSVREQAALQQRVSEQADALDARATQITRLGAQVAGLRKAASNEPAGFPPWAFGGLAVLILLVVLSAYELGRRRPRWPEATPDLVEAGRLEDLSSAR